MKQFNTNIHIFSCAYALMIQIKQNNQKIHANKTQQQQIQQCVRHKVGLECSIAMRQTALCSV